MKALPLISTVVLLTAMAPVGASSSEKEPVEYPGKVPPEISFIACPSAASAVRMLEDFLEEDRLALFFEGLETTGCVQMQDRETSIDRVLKRRTVRAPDGATSTFLAFEGTSERGTTWGIVDLDALRRRFDSPFDQFAADHMVQGRLRLPIGIAAAWNCRRSTDPARLLRSWRNAPDVETIRRAGCTATTGTVLPYAIIAQKDFSGRSDKEMDGHWYVLRAQDSQGRNTALLYWSSWERP